MQRLLSFVLPAVLLLPLASAAQSVPPKTPVRDVTEEYFGVKVVDPYRWLENTSDPEVVAWMKAQNDYTREVLARIPHRDELLARITALDNASDVVSGVQVWGGRYFYYKTGARLRQSQALHSATALERARTPAWWIPKR